jgi:Flp pilus assembly protein TadG
MRGVDRRARPSRRSCLRPGTTLIESAIVLSTTLLVLFGIFEYGYYVMIRQMTANAVREGARQAVANSSTMTTAQVQQLVYGYLRGQALYKSNNAPFLSTDISIFKATPGTSTPASPDSTWTNASFGDSIVVQVDARYKPMLPTLGFLPSTIPVKYTVVMLCEAN